MRNQRSIDNAAIADLLYSISVPRASKELLDLVGPHPATLGLMCLAAGTLPTPPPTGATNAQAKIKKSDYTFDSTADVH